MKGIPIRGSTQYIETFWSYVKEHSSGCWLWTGAKIEEGYGEFGARGNTYVLAHMFSWELANALPSPTSRTKSKDLEFDHLCRNRSCVNPSHLEIVKRRINNLRGYSAAAMNARKTHCPKAHPLSGENLMLSGKYRDRKCRICNRERQSKRRKMRISLGLRSDGKLRQVGRKIQRSRS